LASPLAASLITGPPYEWPTSTTGPWMDLTRLLTAAASPLTLRNSLAAAITV